MERPDTFIFMLLSFIIGVSFASFFIDSFIFIILVVMMGIALIGVFWKQETVSIIGVSLIVFSLGMFSYSFNLFKVENNELIKLNNQEVSLEGIISEEVKKGIGKSELVVDVNGGRVLVFADMFVDAEYGDKVLIKGIAKVPDKLDNFDYRGYLAKDGISILFNFPEVELIEKHKSSFMGNIYSFKDRAREIIKKDMPFREGVVIEAMILGDDSRMDKEFKQNLSLSGLSHAIAISGSHMVLFSAIIFELLMFLGFWRKQAQTAVIIFTFFYIILVGMPASAVRAGIMIGLLLFAQILGRQSSAWRTIILAGFLIVLENPLSLKFDVGFQLSFLAVLGMMLIGPPINYLLNQFFKDRFHYLREILAMTLSAQFFVIPVLVNSFNSISLVSVFSNIVIAPFLPIIMGLGITFPFLGIIVPFLSWPISLFCTIFVSFLIWVVNVSASIPFAYLKTDIPFIVFVFLYTPLIYFIFKKLKRKELEFLMG
ncbi:MAG: ComEC/Rec2 family competence protein [Candidatus Pacebacteria bacterium]|nr:ComEC/Rec2 family competence protein [Candidatus Paceibacterota bacterium]